MSPKNKIVGKYIKEKLAFFRPKPNNFDKLKLLNENTNNPIIKNQIINVVKDLTIKYILNTLIYNKLQYIKSYILNKFTLQITNNLISNNDIKTIIAKSTFTCVGHLFLKHVLTKSVWGTCFYFAYEYCNFNNYFTKPIVNLFKGTKVPENIIEQVNNSTSIIETIGIIAPTIIDYTITNESITPEMLNNMITNQTYNITPTLVPNIITLIIIYNTLGKDTAYTSIATYMTIESIKIILNYSEITTVTTTIVTANTIGFIVGASVYAYLKWKNWNKITIENKANENDE